MACVKNGQVKLIKHVLSAQKNPVLQANMPKIVKNVAFTNVVKSFGVK